MLLRKLRLAILILTFLSIPVFCSVLIPSDEFFVAGILTLCIPGFFIFLVASLIYFMGCRSYWAILPAAILVASLPLTSSSFSFIKSDQNIKAPLHLVTHNMNALKYFIKPADFNSNQKTFQEWAAKNDFDILCLQEMIEVKRVPFLIPGYTKLSSVKDTKAGDNLGLFIFTRYPVVREGKMEFAFNSYNRLMWADVVVGSDTLRVINVHLSSYDFHPMSIRWNLARLRGGLRARSWHAKLIERFIRESRHPVILCGDFNETPLSYPYRKMNSILYDTYQGSGKGFQYSFVFAGLPVRIDHIFISPSLQSKDYQISSEPPWSDHSPVSTRIGLRAQD